MLGTVANVTGVLLLLATAGIAWLSLAENLEQNADQVPEGVKRFMSMPERERIDLDAPLPGEAFKGNRESKRRQRKMQMGRKVAVPTDQAPPEDGET